VPPKDTSHRPWTRLGVLSIAGNLAYEVVAGVAVPLAPHVGVTAAATGFALPAAAVYRIAGTRAAPRGDRPCAVANGLFLAAVVSHFTSWPRTTRAGLPWLVECEGLEGRLMGPYNAVLYASAVAGVGGVIENRRAWPWAAVTAAVAAPLLRRATPPEYARLLAQAAARPRWWNRRLVARTAVGQPRVG
jgi:hypothetical protein